MARVKTTARAYRLGCGCVHEFASLPAVSNSPVLCASCHKRTVVSYRYPDGTCAESCRTDNPKGGVTRVRCTQDKKHAGRHFDASVEIEYDLPTRIRSVKNGQVRGQ
jgi:hypothetical protein